MDISHHTKIDNIAAVDGTIKLDMVPHTLNRHGCTPQPSQEAMRC
jgi:hypothetical protein